MSIILTQAVAAKLCTLEERKFLGRNKLLGLPSLLGQWDSVKHLTMLHASPLLSVLHKHQSCRLNRHGKVEYFENLKGTSVSIKYGSDLRESSRVVKYTFTTKPVEEFVIRNVEGKIITARSPTRVYLNEWNAEGKLTCSVKYTAATGLTRKTFYEHDGHDGHGNMDRILREDGTVSTRKAFDSRGNVIYSASSEGVLVWKTYDDRNNPITLRSSNGYRSWVSYDSHNNVLSLRDNSSAPDCENVYTYYPNGQLQSLNGFNIPFLG